MLSLGLRHHGRESRRHPDDIRITPALGAALAQLRDDLVEPLAALVIVARALLAIAAGTRDREVVDGIGAALGLRPHVLERRLAHRAAVVAHDELLAAVDALADPHELTVERRL